MLVRLAVAGLTAAGAWMWMALGERAQGRPWRGAFRWPTDAFSLSLLGMGLLWWLARPAPVGAYALWGAALGLALARCPAEALPGLPAALAWLMRPRVALAAVLAGSLAVLLVKFPPAGWGRLLFFDDYPTIYSSSVQGLQALAQGGLFGWDTRLLGGYYTVSDVNHNQALFLLPFALFGHRVGFHLLVVVSALCFPVLLALFVRQTLRQPHALGPGLWVGGFFLLTILDNLLHWGMLNSFLGLDLLLANLLLARRVQARRSWAIFPLALTLGLTVYAHVGFFLYSVFFIGLEFLRRPGVRLGRDLALAGLGAVGISLPMTVNTLLYPGYFVESNESWAPQTLAWGEMVARSLGNLLSYADLNAWLALPVKYQAMVLIALPALAWVAWRQGPGRARWAALCAALVVALAALELPGLGLALARMRFALPLFLAVSLVAWAWDAPARRPRLSAWFLLGALLWAAWPQRAVWPAATLPSLRDYHPALMDQVAALPAGEWVVWEAQSSYDVIDDPTERSPHGPTPTHLEAFLPLETDLLYMTLIQEGYHHSIYRGNVLNAGAFRGQAIRRVPLPEMLAFLDRWGVGHLVVWSEPARAYFDAAPEWFGPVWRDAQWTLYAYAGADRRAVLVPAGEGEMEGETLFGFTVALRDVRAGDLVVVRQNAFPAWRASGLGGNIPLFADDERLAFRAPADGSYAVVFRYPRYGWASALALGTVVLGLGGGAFQLWKRRGR